MKTIDRLLDAYDVSHWASLEGGIDFNTFIEKFCTDLDKKSDQDMFAAAKRWRSLLKVLAEYGARFHDQTWGYGGIAFNADEVKDKLNIALDELALKDEDPAE